ncbi:MAG TPA: arsenite methyltransferase, partial [Thermodesulfobacteriota bacterium]|nr:arsenite methyltransferase [Thermodesulfobacteriota bacterium]
METNDQEKIRQKVREQYGGIAKTFDCSSGTEKGSCCGSLQSSLEKQAQKLGYSNEEATQVPEGANMGLGCGNPTAMAGLRSGETVLDLGSGGGFDCFLAARAVGESGKVIGVDMTPEMVSKARENALKADVRNVEFRLGEIEHLPVADQTVDVILSNCVINLSPQKKETMSEAFRVLKEGGRLAISDIVATSPLPEEFRKDLSLISGCIGGAETVENFQNILAEIGFQEVKISTVEESRDFIRNWFPGKNLDQYIVSARIEAFKPKTTAREIRKPESGAAPTESKAIKKKVYGHFQSGFHCAEAISSAILDTFFEKDRPDAIRAASVFGGGIAGSTEELCGAFTGGVLALGYLLGRNHPGDDLHDCAKVTREFKSRFGGQFGSL